jgi:endogenous inhibitor of DNA gyrase (YacG/DUF329 family)
MGNSPQFQENVMTKPCINCGKPMKVENENVLSSPCSDKCLEEMNAWADKNDEKYYKGMEAGPVSYCCICDGMGGRDGSKCWGCQ